MVRRVEVGRFGGAFVFPGGKIDEVDRSDLAAEVITGSLDAEDRPWFAAAFRELAEEVGLYATRPGIAPPSPRTAGAGVFEHVRSSGAVFDASDLKYVANWVTPRRVPVRFNARFFLFLVEDAEFDPVPSAREVTDVRWVEPETALRRGETGEWRILLPTRTNLEFLASGTTPRELLNLAPHPASIAPVEPLLRIEGGKEIAWLPAHGETSE